MIRILLPLTAIAAGILFPAAWEYTWLIQYILMGMLFFSFMDIDLKTGMITKSHFGVFLLNLIIPVILYYILIGWNPILAGAAFITAISPTAIASPVVLGLIGRKVEYAAFSVILTNIGIALLLPFLLPWFSETREIITTTDVLFPVLITVGVPLILSQSIKKWIPPLHKTLRKYKMAAFYLLVLNVYIASCKSTHFLRLEMNASFGIVALIAAMSLFIVIFKFRLGWIIGGKELNAEASQALGQKNNGFTLWVALTFLGPLATLGPVFHILFQNIYIAWELYYFGPRRKKRTE